MIEIKLPDGSIKEFEKEVSVKEVAESIGKRLAKDAIAGKINGKAVDLSEIISENSEVEIITPRSEEAVEIIRHSTAHLMAQAVIRLFPNVKVTIGPAIENGFYYDFDSEHKFNEEDLLKIEDEMRKIIKENHKFERTVVSKEEAIRIFTEKEETYKVELINDLGGDSFSLYKQGEFLDLCRGPHVPSTGYLGSFKLKSVAGAYWRGNSDNKMLQRIYGYAFTTDKELKKFLRFLEEAEKRDHRKLGKELELFMMSEYGAGFPFFLPKGMEIRNILEDLWRKEHKKAGYQEIKTPIMLNRTLWETSGHWFNYKENMYTTKIDDEDVAIKPMNCPGGILVYKNNVHSYRDFPLRTGELGLVHRHELSGVLHGLMRVRAFTQDDAHIFMTEEQIEDEIVGVIDLIDKFYSKLFGFEYEVELSTKPEKAIGADEIWETATNALRGAIERKGMDYKINEGDGAFYGPKLDFKIKDCIGRTWQCGTIQLDFNLPERFDLNYIGVDGEKHRPVMIHRVIYGSLERFIGILIEHYAGAFPLWLAPVQVKVLTISDEQLEYAKKVVNLLKEKDIRVELDNRNEKIGFKIREANMKKIPVQLILGKNEMEVEEVNVRRFGSKESTGHKLTEFIESIVEESKIKFEK
ncbi:threonine--tRNA ligase [Haliovirga abyssi]|uniref:Threonine--tRNA ligase n=1 Tax=Haliovirga abyssi TaxID=2996794 RepID=A0AAU9DAA0_9FUSO|nr:threonine--tRNA ligase [Haliovirga abyssi]